MTDSISIDCFAGAGGASCAILQATGASPAVAINHWPTALSVHQRNHRSTVHVTEDVWRVDPIATVAGRRVDVAWFSPDCTHFSRAKAAVPRSNKLRGLAWSVVRWAAAVRPSRIFLENVPEFLHWGPLDSITGLPIRARRGQTFRAFVRRLQHLGYVVDWRVLSACDYGTPTTRRRLYLVARRDGHMVRWPEPTHGPGRAHPWHTAAEIIDWSLPIPSIFDRKKPLVEATLRRIAEGIERFVLGKQEPFVAHLTHGGRLHSAMAPLPTVTSANRGELAVVAPYLVHVSNGERQGQTPRVYSAQATLGTVVAGGVKHALVVAFLAKHFGGHTGPGSSLREPLGTVTAQDHHALVAAFLHRYNGVGGAPESLRRPLGTVTSRDRFALVTVAIQGETYAISDIGQRILTPRELARAQGFPEEYAIDRGADGCPITRTDQVRLIGNSVCQQVAAALIGANGP